MSNQYYGQAVKDAVFAGRCRGCGALIQRPMPARAEKIGGIRGVRIRCLDCGGSAYGRRDPGAETIESPAWYLDSDLRDQLLEGGRLVVFGGEDDD